MMRWMIEIDGESIVHRLKSIDAHPGKRTLKQVHDAVILKAFAIKNAIEIFLHIDWLQKAYLEILEIARERSWINDAVFNTLKKNGKVVPEEAFSILISRIMPKSSKTSENS